MNGGGAWRTAVTLCLGALALSPPAPGADGAPAAQALYDTHAHFFSHDIARYPVDTRGAREGEAALRRRLLATPATPQRLFPMWDAAQVLAGAGVQYSTVYKTDNRYLLDVAAQYPARVSAVLILDAAAATTPALLERLVVERGAVGLRLVGRIAADGTTDWLDGAAALETWRVAERHGLAMVLMATPASVQPAVLQRVAALARRFPSTTITLDHFGWAGVEPADGGLPPALRALAGVPNLYYKLTTINFHLFEAAGIDSADFVRRAVDHFGADHLMWGSDFGNTRESYADMVARARDSARRLTPDERRQFLCDTGRRLFASRDKGG